jgi:hypothetical protein
MPIQPPTRECRAVFFAAILAASLATASADATTFVMGNALYSYCAVPTQDETATSICMGYIDAIVDVMTANAINGFRACIPQTVRNPQLLDVVNQYLRANPEKRHFTASSLVAAALSAAFPCR